MRRSSTTPKLTEKYVPFKAIEQNATKLTGKEKTLEVIKSYNVKHIKRPRKHISLHDSNNVPDLQDGEQPSGAPD